MNLNQRVGSLVTASVIAAGVFLMPRLASANIGGDLDLAFPVGSGAPSSGWGFGIRVGKELHLPLVVLTPEVGFSYYGLGDSVKLYNLKAGGRLSIGEVLRPGVFVHVGEGDTVFPIVGHHWGFSYDAGLSLDFTALPMLNIGAHVAYDHVSVGDGGALKFIAPGINADLTF